MPKKTPTKRINHCGFGKSRWFRVPFWWFFNADCKIHDDEYAKGGTQKNRIKADIGFLWRMLEDVNDMKGFWMKWFSANYAILYGFLVLNFGWFPWFLAALKRKKNGK